MRRKVSLLLLIATISLMGCTSNRYEDDCKETCYSKNYFYYKYIYISSGTDICLCKNIEGEIENVW